MPLSDIKVKSLKGGGGLNIELGEKKNYCHWGFILM